MATQPGACALMTASTPWPAASFASMVGSRRPNRPSRTMGIATPRRGHAVMDRLELEGDHRVPATKQLRAGLRGDDTVDCKPADREEKRERGPQVRAAAPEYAASEHDLGQPAPRTGVAEKAEDERRRNRAQHRGGKAVPDAESVIRREQAGREQARVVPEGAGPEESELARPAVAFGGPDRVDAVRLDLPESVGLDATSCDVAQSLPPLALPSSGSCGRRRAPSQPLCASRW